MDRYPPVETTAGREASTKYRKDGADKVVEKRYQSIKYQTQSSAPASGTSAT